MFNLRVLDEGGIQIVNSQGLYEPTMPPEGQFFPRERCVSESILVSTGKNGKTYI